jgi:hypothetical protein
VTKNDGVKHLKVIGPKPVSASQEDALGQSPFRQLYCQSYNSCLDHAVKNRWPSFSCGECSAYRRISSEQERQDLDAIADMLRHANRFQFFA